MWQPYYNCTARLPTQDREDLRSRGARSPACASIKSLVISLTLSNLLSCVKERSTGLYNKKLKLALILLLPLLECCKR